MGTGAAAPDGAAAESAPEFPAEGGGPWSAEALAGALLDWYDAHHRALPWRVGPAAARRGERPDPYRVWLAEVMLQQTTVAAATPRFRDFLARWPTVEALAAAPLEEVLAAWAGLGYYARARNLHRCAREIAARGGRFPDTEAELVRLPGVGPYTAAAIAAIAFDRPAVVVDGNVERVMARLFAETAPLPAVKPALRARMAALTPTARPGDFAQAVMDLGATVCTPRRPACERCPWRRPCSGRALGLAGALPRRVAKAAKPVRRGVAYVALDGAGRVLTERRPPAGLLGGMLALPTTPWEAASAADPPPPADSLSCADPTPPLAATWHPAGEVRHTFTHFHLQLAVCWARVRLHGPEAIPARDAEAAMPTVFAKALRLALRAAAAGAPSGGRKEGGPRRGRVGGPGGGP